MTKRKKRMEYNDTLDADTQVSMEEHIAAKLFDFPYEDPDQRPHEEDAMKLGRAILKDVLWQFRPDLFV